MKQLSRRSSLLPNLSEIHQAIDRVFETPLFSHDNWLSFSDFNWSPSVDVKDEGKQYLIRADIPGVEIKDVEITLDNDCLTIKGSKQFKFTKKEEKKDYMHLERASGSFYRCLTLPHADADAKLLATAKNGVVELIVPKLRKSNSHKVTIKAV